MDARLVAWARAVKSRQARRGRVGWPVLWLFTDAERLGDPRAAVSRLPKGLCGVVLRHDAAAERGALGRDLARICRARRLVLVVAGNAGLAARLGAGLHLRAGRRPRGGTRSFRFLTASAHSLRDLVRARRAGAVLAFLSPIFPTASHPGAAALGPGRWAAIARRGGLPVLALGGVEGSRVRALPLGICGGAAAIGALTPDRAATQYLAACRPRVTQPNAPPLPRFHS